MYPDSPESSDSPQWAIILKEMGLKPKMATIVQYSNLYSEQQQLK